MEKMMLSLKNIYKILMTNDFPIYSESVINEKNRKGQTLLRFWQSQLADEFRCLPVGKMIWRNDGKRNRYISNLCNRSLEQKLCAEYAGELVQQITIPAMLNQIERFTTFLSARAYRHDVLLRRIQELLRLCSIDDNRITEQMVEHLLNTVQGYSDIQCQTGADDLFQAGYLLTVLTLYAAAGDAMDDPRLSVFCGEAYSMRSVWSQYKANESRHTDEVIFLSIHAGILQDKPLPPHRFFGREEELYDLREMVSSNRKCLISGMGGIGKTELLRQLLRLCSEEKLADRIVVVPYELGIVESFLRAFPGYQRQEPEEGFQSILRMLERQADDGFRLLVLIDNVNNSLEEDPALEKLLLLQCSVLMTSRRTELSGFEVYSIKEPSISTCTLIFRDNFGKPIGQEGRGTLKMLLQDTEICHPLTLKLMARASSSNGWSVPQLAEQLREDMTGLTWTEKDQTIRLDRILRQLYSQTMLSDCCREVADLFTLLPRGSYTRDFLERYFPYLEDDLQQKVDILETEGWLEGDSGGYSMHPLIAQCLRRKVITEEKSEPMLRTLRKQSTDALCCSAQTPHNEHIQSIAQILIHISQFIVGPISREFMLDILSAMSILVFPRKTVEKYQKYLEQLFRRCTIQDDLVRVRCCTVLGIWHCGDAERAEAVFRAQEKNLTVPKDVFLEFCLSVGSDMILKRQYALAEEMLKEVLSEEASPVQKGKAYYQLAGLNHCAGESEKSMHWAKVGAEYARSHPQCDRSTRFFNTSMLCMIYLKFNREAESRELLKELDALMSETSPPAERLEYLSCKGTYELVFGEMEKALDYGQQELELSLEYNGKDRNYYSILGRIAQTLQRLSRYDESVCCYDEVLEHARQVEDSAMLQMASNNISVLYLVMQEPENALVHLETAVAEGRKQGGLMLGESLKNKATAYKQMGNTTQEYICLQEAVPLLEASYGPEHPRSQAARQRFDELDAADIKPDADKEET